MWSPINPPAGETVTFTVTIRNQGIAKAADSTIHYYIGDHDSGNQHVPSITAGALATSTFTWKAKAGPHLIKVVVDPYNNVIEVNEDNNEKIINFGGALPADLTVQNITWSPEDISEGDNITFTVTIKNQGSGKADYSYVTYYIDDNYPTLAYVIPLDPGATYNTTFTWVAEAGTHTIKVVADSEKRILEGDENNNEKSVIYPVPADLTVQNITWSLEDISEGDNITFTVTIKNQGSGKADYSSIAYYVDDGYLTSADVYPLDPGATDNKTFTWVAEAGTHTIKVVVDSDNRITESNETNNERSVALPAPSPRVSKPSPASSTEKQATPTETAPVVKSKPNDSSAKESGSYLWVFFIPIAFLVTSLVLIILKSQSR
jgi:subtilase family serine protease